MFFLKEVPPEDDTPSDFRRFDPRAAEPLSPELRLAIRDARARREAALELFHELGEKPPQFPHTAKLTDDPEKVGERLRDALLGDTSPTGNNTRIAFNFWRAAAESVGVLVFQAQNVDHDEMRGFSIPLRPLPAVVLNIKDAYGARSFSLLHEITHVMLNRGGLCLLEESGPQTKTQRIEVFCNHVAGAALLPASSLLRQPETPRELVQQIPDDALNALARRYGASEETVVRRLLILRRVTLDFYRHKRKAYQLRHESLRKGRQTAGFAPPFTLALARNGRLFARLVLEAYDEERITASDLSEYLSVRFKHLERIRSAMRSERETGESL